MPGLLVYQQLPEFTQTHVHWVSDAIQPSHPLSSPYPSAPISSVQFSSVAQSCPTLCNPMNCKESDATERLTLPLSLAFVSLTTSVKLFHLWILESFSIEMTTFRLGSVPGLGRSPGEGKGCPLQYCGLQNSMDCIVHGIAKNWTRLSNFHSLTHTVVRSKVKYNMRNLVECLPCGRKPTNCYG